MLQSDDIVYLWCKTIWYPAVSYGWTILNRTKVKCIFIYLLVNLQKGTYKNCHSWTHFHCSRKPKCFSKPCCEKVSKLTFKL